MMRMTTTTTRTAERCCAGLPTLQWHCHPCHAGIFGASSLLLQWRPCCPHHASVVAIIALALLPSFCWHCHPHCAGIVALVALALLPLSCWCLHCCAGIDTIIAKALSTSLHWCHRCHCTGTIAIVAMAPLPLLPCITILIALASPLLGWRGQRCCTGIFALFVQVLLP
jgi:hypothetical protein